MSCELIDIDGSVLEGGGQILRIALTLSTIRRIPIRIRNIRAGRSKPGLREQHLKGVELVRDLSNGKVTGADLGSTEIQYWPGPAIPGGRTYEATIKTAGSISLLLQVALPCLLFAKNQTELRLRGGTNAEMAPQIDYMTEVFRPVLQCFGATFDFDLIRRGYFPRGGGEVVVTVKPIGPVGLNPVSLLDRGDVVAVTGWSFVAGSLPIKIAHLMGDSAASVLKKDLREVNIERYKEDRNVARDNCAGIILVAETSTGCVLGGSALGKSQQKETAEDTGKRAADELLRGIERGGCVDEYCQDQIIVFMALARGMSTVRVGELTMHTKTAIFIAEKLTHAKFQVIPGNDNTNLIECNGIVASD